jgi:proteasome lid subunit RPN8/RPN11
VTARIVDVPGRGRARETRLADGTLRREYIGAEGKIRGGGQSPLLGSGRPRPRAATPLPRFYGELEPTYEFTISASAARTIREEVRKERWLETGGWLFADPDSPSHIVLATGPGESGVLKPRSVELGFEGVDRIRHLAPHLALCGDYHQHPSADLLPSSTDRRAWMRGAELTRSHWVSLVYAPAADMWSQPECLAFITVRNNGSPFCEPLRLKEV